MADYEKAVKDLKRFSEQFSGVFALAEALESIPSIERAADEATARLEVLRKQEADIAERLATSEGEADEIQAIAKAAAAKVRKDADEYAAGLATEAKELEREVAAGKADLAEITARRDEIRAQISQLRERLVP